MIRSPKEIEHIPTIKDRQSLPFPIPHIQTPTFHPCIALRKASPPLSPYLFIADFTCRVLDPARYESVLRWLQQITEPDTQNSMSWQAYIDSSLVGTGTVDKAAIYSKAGDSTWAISKGFELSQPEVTAIVQGFDKNDALFGSGIKIGGQKYFTIRADDKVIQGRKGEEGVVCTRTKQAVLVAHYPAGQQAGEVTKVVLSLGDYLINLGY